MKIIPAKRILAMLIAALMPVGVGAEAIDLATLPPSPTFMAAYASPTPEPTPTPMPSFEGLGIAMDKSLPASVAESAIEDDGVMRVFLRSLAMPSSIRLTLDGVYTIENDAGFRFDRGAEVVLSDGGDAVYLSVGGLTINMGASLTLTRHQSDDEVNGFYIEEAEKDNLYMGDLTVYLGGNGGLRAVLSIGMEDYLCGVVAYEMSDSWPLEALKAQAVAARTYAIQRKRSAGNREYDVVDTTADQVFKGFDPDYTNVIEAVRSTAGIVGTYNGRFATCYYTASNGGQTALPDDIWHDGSNYGYLTMKEDPYDLENPNSMVATATLSATAAENEAIRTLLQESVEKQAAQLGLEGSNFRFESITGITPVNPVREGSLQYQALRFTVSASTEVSRYEPSFWDVGAPSSLTPNASANAALRALDYLRRLTMGLPYELVTKREKIAVPIEVDLDVYGLIKPELNVGMNSSDCELINVYPTGNGFTLEMRRYGHGVGMSQRGAQRMAGVHGKSFTDILSFYYPSMTLERISWNTPALSALEELPDNVGFERPLPTPTPPPAPLPALKAGEYYATVNLEDKTSSLNMRRSPTTQAPVVTLLDHGRRVIVSSEVDANGWVNIHTAEVSGYVKLEYLVKE